MGEPPGHAEGRSPPGRVLGLDLGDVRTGVAISDADRRLAVPLGTVRAGAPQDLRAISALVRDNDITLVVVGHPLSMSGRPGTRAQHAEQLAGALRSILRVPVALHDERLSTVEAERALRQAGVRSRDRRRTIDSSAATVILQSWLDSERGRRPGTS
ncbi:MAG TPA: Holliday junction resolvase RuvX [Actinomycetota bacterium]